MKRIKSFSKRYMGLAYVLVVAAVFAVWVLKSGEGPEVVRQLSGLSSRWLWAGAGLLIGYVLVRALTLYAYLRGEGSKISFVKSLAVTGVGQFYSAITPSSSGGQPVEVLAMSRWGVSAPVATAAVTVQFIGFQLALVGLGAALWIATRTHVALNLGPVRWLVVLGFFINSAMPLFVGILGLNRRVLNALSRTAVWLLTRFRIVRDRDAAQKKVDHMMGEYQASVAALFKKPLLAAKVLLLSLIQIGLMMSIILCVYRAFWLHGVSSITLVTLQTLLYIGASFMPLPGASGAQEYGFSVFFGGIFPERTMLSAIFLWRAITYYLLMLIGFISVLAEGGMRFFEAEQKERETNGAP